MLTATTAMRESVAGERRAGVEAEPAEREDERAEHDHRDVVAGNGIGACRLASYLPMRGPRILAPTSAITPPGHVHDRAAGEVDVAVAEAEVRAELREPAAAPDPVP